MNHQDQHHQQTQHQNAQHHRIYERQGILQPTPILHAMKANTKNTTTVNTKTSSNTTTSTNSKTTNTRTSHTNTKPNTGTAPTNANRNVGGSKTTPCVNPAPVPLPAHIPIGLQRSYTTLDEGDAPQHALRTSHPRRPESYCETNRKSDPIQDHSKSIISWFQRLGSGRFGQGNSPDGKKGHGGAHGGQAGGHGGSTASPASGKKVSTAEKKLDPGRYEKQAASTFYQLTEAKGEPVGEVGVVEGKEPAPPATSYTPKRRASEPSAKARGVFSRAGNRMSAKKNQRVRNKTPDKEAQKGSKPATDPQKPSSKTTDPQKPGHVPQKGGTDTRNPSNGVSQGGRRTPDSLPNQNKTADVRGASDPHRGDPKTTEAKRGRRKDPSGTLEAQGHAKDTEMTRSSRKKSRARFFKSGAKCVGSEGGDTTEEEVDGGGGGGVGGADKHWGRHGSFRGGYGGAGGGGLSSGDPSHSDTELGKLSAPHSLLDGECGSMGRGSLGGGSEASERGMDQGRVTAWATSFEKLLEDPAGLHTFAEFLKKEYSHENIYFYTACERYKRLTCQEEMQAVAKKIFERHLCSGAPEPVNVDSQARQDAQDGLHLPSETLFGQAQKQIFNLMKFDSYSRFLKSGLYTDCLTKERRGQPLPYPGDHTLDPDLRLCPDDAHTKLKKSCSDADERRRRSILPLWSRKDRSKSKDRGEAEYRRRRKHQQHQPQHHQHQRLTSDSSSLRSISGSQTSLNSSSDLPMGRRAASRESLTSGGEPGGGGGGSLSGGEGGVGGSSSRSRSSSNTTTCRVFLPDSSKSVVLLKPQETVQEVMARLLERRGLPYTYFEVYMDNNNKVVCRDQEAITLQDKKVRLEPRSVFQLVLPCQRPLFVKADPAKAIGDRLKPLLTKAGLKMDLLHIHKDGEEKALNLKGPIGDLDGLKVIVQTKEDVRDWGVEGGRQKRRTTAGTLNTTSNTTTGSTTSLDDITNRVFQDLRNGKMERFDDFSVIDLDARSTRTDSSDKSSGIQDFCRRNSFGLEKDSSTHRRYKHRTPDIKALQHHHHHHHHHQDHHHHHHHNTKRRGGGGGGVNSTTINGGGGGGGVATTDNDNELYEGLKRAQRSRLDDQRGTEINFELPEFLKNDKKQDSGAPSLADHLLARLECSQVGGGAPPPEYFSLAHPEVWGGLPAHPPPPPAGPPSPNTTLVPEPELDLDDFEDTLRGTEGGDSAPPSPLAPPHAPLLGLDTGGVGVIPPLLPPSLPSLPLSPPPLPPKPKVGGVRGPPPRPPSRQLHLNNPPPPSFPPPPPSTSNSEEEGVLAPPPSLHPLHQPPSLPPLHLGRPPPSQETFNISFV